MSNEGLVIALAQFNARVGDVEFNRDRIIEWARRAQQEFDADVVLFPELALTGYPPEDLLFRTQFIEQLEAAVDDIARRNPGLCLVVGTVRAINGQLYNSAVVTRPGCPPLYYYKQKLPNYSVFDEYRYFSPGHEALVFNHGGVKCGVTICEDIWHPQPMAAAVAEGAEIILNLNASPFHQSKIEDRMLQVRQRISENKVPVCYTNLVGGQDELVFDGHSFVMDGQGQSTLLGAGFEETLAALRFTPDSGLRMLSPDQVEKDRLAQLYSALVLATRDYVRKNGFSNVILGLSGGIDSSLVLAIAVDALGADAVQAIMMPYHYTSRMSRNDAAEQAQMLGVTFSEIAIAEPVEAFMRVLQDEFQGMEKDVTEENLQARSRGVILMAVSNKKGAMLLTTGNKSEMAVGYATLYGDMAGGFAPLKDVSKLNVYALAEYRNSLGPAIPQRVIERPPSAELAPDQKDEDSLPPYDVLDPILEMYIERDCSVAEIVEAGFDADTVHRIAWLVDVNEYKRRQSPPGARVTQRAFGKERRYPITSGFKRV